MRRDKREGGMKVQGEKNGGSTGRKVGQQEQAILARGKSKNRKQRRGPTVKSSPHWQFLGGGQSALDRKGGREGSKRQIGVDAAPPQFQQAGSRV